MPTVRNNLSVDEAKKMASDAVRNGVQKITMERQGDGRWTVTVA